MALRGFTRFIYLPAALACLWVGGRAGTDELQRAFATPPNSARISVFWMWFGPAVTKPELERQMKVMKEAGVGGFRVFPLYPAAVDDEIAGVRNLQLHSAEFREALAFTAAKAQELGLEMELLLGSAWPLGGPMFTPAQAAGRLRVETMRIAAGVRSVNAPRLFEGETLISAWVAPLRNGAADATAAQALTLHEYLPFIPLQLPGVGREPAEVSFFIAGLAPAERRKAAVGDEGPALDHYDAAAVDKFLREVAAPETAATAGLQAVHCDSLEVSGSNWTKNLLVEFQRRRGYDLKPLLPALVTDLGGPTADIRHDWAQTLTELLNENFISRLQFWSHQHGLKYSMQAYGWPPAALHSYAWVDAIEGEGSKEFGWKNFSSMRWASSASHLLGHPITSSESWTWLHSKPFRATPLDLKAHADLYFLQGSNRLVGAGWPYSPPGAAYPGWRMYAAPALNEKNPWWTVMPEVTAYLQRVSHVLRQGRPVNDVALYLANSDAWADFDAGGGVYTGWLFGGVGNHLGPEIVPAIVDAGFGLDFFDDQLLERCGHVEGGALAFADMRYNAVVLAGVERMPLATLRRIEAFARGGGLVIATRRLPERVPGYRATAAEQAEFHAIVGRLFAGPDAAGVFVSSDREAGAQLAQRLAPDATFAPVTPAVGFVHRQTETEDIYFIANTSNVPANVVGTFRVDGRQAEWWEPMTGRVEPAEVLAHRGGATTIAVSLPPHGSRLLVFTRRSLPSAPKRPTYVIGSIDLSHDWRVTFEPGQPEVTMAELRSWTEDAATRNFSGVAVYEKQINVPAKMLGPGVRWELDFGESRPLPSPGMTPGDALDARAPFQRNPPHAEMQPLEVLLEAPVREAAVVFLNGRRAGSVWHPPYRLEVTELLRAGENLLRVEVANLAVNQMAGQPASDRSRIDAVYGERVRNREKKSEPVAAGLLGPITLIATGLNSGQ